MNFDVAVYLPRTSMPDGASSGWTEENEFDMLFNLLASTYTSSRSVVCQWCLGCRNPMISLEPKSARQYDGTLNIQAFLAPFD
jgi:hypothetical protein